MKIKYAIFTVLAAFLVLIVNLGSEAVPAAEIDEVRRKPVLNAEDFKIIDDFLAQSVQELIRTRDFTSIAKVRTVILSKQSSQQGQYAQKFTESARRHIAEGFVQAGKISRPERRIALTINLLILVNGLQDSGLADLAIEKLRHENMVVRYWAVRCLTNSSVIRQLNSSTNPNSSKAPIIAEHFRELIETSNPEIIAMMAKFAAGVDIPEGEELLSRIADVRIMRYADWTVKHELYDCAILRYLCNKIPLASDVSSGTMETTSGNKPEMARRFAQLFSYAIQRYVKGFDILNSIQKSHLVSVMVETEDKCIGRLLGRSQMTIRRAVERENMSDILAEHDRLLGSATTPGQLPSRLGFDYGTNPEGPIRTAPLPLPDPPVKSSK
jgi:hypothetical protein